MEEKTILRNKAKKLYKKSREALKQASTYEDIDDMFHKEQEQHNEDYVFFMKRDYDFSYYLQKLEKILKEGSRELYYKITYTPQKKNYYK